MSKLGQKLIKALQEKGDGHTQKNCMYGYVLPDRCRYKAHLGCDCGEYPPLRWNPEKGQYENYD